MDYWAIGLSDVICDLLLNRFTATWNLFVFYYSELGGQTDRRIEDRRIDDVIIGNFCLFILIYKTNRFHLAVGLFSNRSQMT